MTDGRRAPLVLIRVGTVVAAAGLLLCPSDASAHMFVGDGGPGAGFIHPLTGPDHLLAMFTVGLLSARLGRWSIWTVPGLFLAAMALGGVVGLKGYLVSHADLGVACSVLALGLLLAGSGRYLLPIAFIAVAAFGFFHGYVHGIEMPRASSPKLYALGFLCATAGLHLMGVLSGLLVECRRNSLRRLRAAGVTVAVAGLFFVFQVTHSAWI